MVAVPGLLVAFHTPARSIRPPSSGSPGSRLKIPTSRLAQTSCSMSRPGQPAQVADQQHSPAERGQDQREQRAGRRDQELAPGRGRLLLDLGEAAQRVEQDPAHRQPEPAGDQRVAQLVEQDGHVQEHHEGGGHHVPHPARIRPAPHCSRRGRRTSPRSGTSTARCIRVSRRAARSSLRDPTPAARAVRAVCLPQVDATCWVASLDAPAAPVRPAAGAEPAAKPGNCRRLPLLSLAWPTMVRRSAPRLNQARPVAARGRRPAAAAVDTAAGAGAAAGTVRRTCPRTRRRSLSPSRAGDFLTCPLLYRFRVIDRLPEPPSPAAVRGTLVHAVLERLFDQRRPTGHRTRHGHWYSRNGPGCRKPNRIWPACSTTTLSAPHGWTRSGPCWTGISPWRTRAGSSRPTGSCAWRRS